jgi:hypothetical protein
MPLRRLPAGRYGGAEGPGQPSRERVDPGKADTAPKAPRARARRRLLVGFANFAAARSLLFRGDDPPEPPVRTRAVASSRRLASARRLGDNINPACTPPGSVPAPPRRQHRPDCNPRSHPRRRQFAPPRFSPPPRRQHQPRLRRAPVRAAPGRRVSPFFVMAGATPRARHALVSTFSLDGRAGPGLAPLTGAEQEPWVPLARARAHGRGWS